ncbi:H-NS histone family protein [Ketogulonicigenium vulgare]|uniref:Histone-like protein nucleoid-structuring protein H-NS n=1 Tax=Ketogulonicigenium vulgare (strain WSH-001) TaxID=759362 RepID=F9Y3U8_KETVW|nr:H-NS histone family protein [Ketogulonicigenium vulgare]ADO42264.1 DNA-binding protein, H-NS family [Ketogulonicigenium vulgare Y25]AEM40462.1 Histone-like protein nucleoid-structuring protein H-NS [Ketogulonicigenium vulgare WSH-001]ALJ80647.1 nucleoid-structuring protein H-NS [Ketogulonicigenium vulgare]ANW34950.1 nucleoid-structuring protein H-NS [Ketogulonicigenium vulgare]AOZ54178.1 DNA-binding protein, H-NS family [Ketogulonicigenium vulgare]
MDLNSLDRKELVKLRVDVDRALATLDERNRLAALEAAQQAASAYGFSLAQLTDEISMLGNRRMPGVARYRNPENPDQTWSGRGRKPQWVHDLDAAGMTLEECEL